MDKVEFYRCFCVASNVATDSPYFCETCNQCASKVTEYKNGQRDVVEMAVTTKRIAEYSINKVNLANKEFLRGRNKAVRI